MHAISTRPGRAISARALRLGLLAAVATPALLVSTVGTASASEGAYPPAMDCANSASTGGASTGGASIGTESGSASGASCAVAATTVTNPNLAPAGRGNGNAGNAGAAANAGTPGQPQGTQAGLAFTGSDVTTPAILAGGLIVGGLLVTVGARRRRSH